MMISCSDVSDAVVAMLTALGYDLGDDEYADHSRILDALAECHLIPLEPIQDPNRGYTPKFCHDTQITIEERIASVIGDEIHIEPTSPYFNVEETSQRLSRQILRQILAEFRPDLFEREGKNANS